jgi:hypothetical protein
VSNDFLLVIADRAPLAWMLTEGRMAFPAHRSREAAKLRVDDRLFLYTTRGCFHNPSRGRGRVIGEAIVTSPASSLDVSVEFGEHAFPLGCSVEITSLAHRGEGPEIATMVDKLNMFPNPRAWPIQLRRVLAPLDKHDAGVLHKSLAPLMHPLSESKGGYLVRPGKATADGATRRGW